MVFINKFIVKVFLFSFILSTLLFLSACPKKYTDINFNVIPPTTSDNSNLDTSSYDDENDYDEDENSYNSDASYDIDPLIINCETQGTSAAKLELIDSTIPSGIVIIPEIPGVWRWHGESSLYFYPSKEWAAGIEYTVTMSPEIFNNELPETKRNIKFASPSFNAYVASSSVSRAPGEERTPRFTAQINFTHAVDKDSFEKNLKLTLDGKEVKFSTIYDSAMRKAFIRSEAIKILNHPQKFVLTGSGFVSSISKSKVAEEIRVSETVPDGSGLFYIKNIKANIVRDKENTPNQVVFLEFSDAVSRETIAENLKICLLPKQSEGWPENEKRAIEYCTQNKSLPIVQGPSEGLAETIHPFLLDIDHDTDDRRIEVIVVFDKKVNSLSGFPLKDTFYSIIAVPNYPKEIYMVQDGAILSLAGDKIFTFASRGIKKLYVSIGRLTNSDQLQHVISSTKSGGLKYNDFTGSFDETNFAVFNQQTIPLANKSPKEVNYASVDLGKYISNDKVGLFFIKATGDNNRSISRVILVTDMGILRKHNKDDSSSIFVVSLSKQRPVGYAKVEVLGKNGVPVYSGFTNENGRFDYPGLSDLRREKTPIAVVVKKDGDTSYLPLNVYDRKVDYSRFDIGGVETSEASNKNITGFIFTDRGIYRPGEDVNIAAIVKQNDWRSLAGVSVQAVIEDPNGKSILKKRFSLSNDGMFDFNHKTETVNPTGSYTVDLFLLENDKVKNHLGSTSFDVEEFEPDTMRIKTSIVGKSDRGWQKPDKISGYVKIDNMFGNPSSDRRVKWGVEVYPTSFPSLDGYIFSNPNADKSGAIRKVFVPEILDGRTNKSGEAKANIELNNIGKGFYRIMLSAEGFEPGSGQSVYGQDRTFISTLDYIVGYKTLGNLNFVRRNSAETVDFIAINNNIKKIAINDLKYRLININYVMSLVKSYDGGYGYQSVEKRSVVNTGDFPISEAGVTYDLPTKEAGRFLFEIVSSDGTVVGRVPFFVTGATNLQSGIEKNAELSLQLNKSEYSPGETVEVNIISPFTGVGLITIEGDKVYASQWFTASTTSSLQKIVLPKNIEGNAYINVSFIRSPDSKDIFINPHSYGIVPFTINKEKRNIKIKLSAPDITIPGDEMLIKYSTDKDARLILYGVDEGILQVADYRLPDPLSYFLRKKALGVRTFQTVDLILPDYGVIKEAFATGGGEAAIAQGLNPFARKAFKPTAFWSTIIDVKAGEEYEYKYTVPEYFNGTMKVMAVASSEQAVGSAVTSALARSPIVMLPNAPYAVSEGDTFKVSMGVTNNIEGATGQSDIKITAKHSDHLKIIGDTVKSISVPVGAEKTIMFDVTATEKIGPAELIFTAENDKIMKPIRMSATLSVRPATIYQTKLNIGKFKSADIEVKNIFRDMHEPYAKRNIGVSSSPLAALVGMGGFLAEYPHGCSEQITSKIFPLLYINDFINFSGNDNKNIRDIFDYTVNVLRSRQNGSSGFSMWSNYNDVNDFVSVYIMHFLTDAESMGYIVPRDMKERGISFLNDISSSEPKDLNDARTKAYAAYLLARNGIIVSRQISNLEEYLEFQYPKEWKSDLTAAYIGSSYILMKQDEKGQSLMKGAKPISKGYVGYGDYDSSSVRHSMYLYLTGKHYSSNLSNVINIADDIISDISDGYFNTISSSYAIIALGSYSDKIADVPPTVTSISGKDSTTLAIGGNQIYTTKFNNNIDKLVVKYPESIKNGRFYYVLQAGYDKKSPNAVSNGIEITKEYVDTTGKKVSEVKQGDEITVNIRVRITGKDISYIDNVAITDLLPGGTEVIRNRDNSLGKNFDIREDRVLIYTYLGNQKSKEFSYKLKALSAGTFTVPPVFAENMYKSSVNGNNASSSIKILSME